MHEKNIRFYNRRNLAKNPGGTRDFCYEGLLLFFYIFDIQDIQGISFQVLNIVL